MPIDRFVPFQTLAIQLLPAIDGTTDGSHDVSHLERVWRNAVAIQQQEGGDLRIIAAAVLLHDCVAIEKNSPLRLQASELSANRAREALLILGWGTPDIDAVTGAIRTHSFSAGRTPETLEARILQDADRLDAIGTVGIARCFYTAGRMGSDLYDPADPRGQNRDLDDRRFALDHFPKKLLTLSSGFQTATGTRLAQSRHGQVEAFYQAMISELDATPILSSERKQRPTV